MVLNYSSISSIKVRGLNCTCRFVSRRTYLYVGRCVYACLCIAKLKTNSMGQAIVEGSVIWHLTVKSFYCCLLLLVTILMHFMFYHKRSTVDFPLLHTVVHSKAWHWFIFSAGTSLLNSRVVSYSRSWALSSCLNYSKYLKPAFLLLSRLFYFEPRHSLLFRLFDQGTLSSVSYWESSLALLSSRM